MDETRALAQKLNALGQQVVRVPETSGRLAWVEARPMQLKDLYATLGVELGDDEVWLSCNQDLYDALQAEGCPSHWDLEVGDWLPQDTYTIDPSTVGGPVSSWLQLVAGIVHAEPQPVGQVEVQWVLQEVDKVNPSAAADVARKA